ncbi:MAG: glycosyltransferase family 2 protein [Waddliaceae bacterium]
MSTQDSVSILLPVYNGSSFIEEQVRSIMGQSYDNFTLMIRDNCSEDRTVDIVSSLAKQYEKITLLKSSKNIGILGSISQLIDAVGGAPYIMLADGDDVWLRDKVALTMKHMKSLENRYGVNTPCLIHTDLKVVDRSLNVISPSFLDYTKLNPKKDKLHNLLCQNIVTGCTLMMNRRLLTLAKPIPPEAVMHDWWIALAASAFGVIGFVPSATMLYRQHGNNDTGAKKYGLSAYFRYKKFNTNEQIIAQTEAFIGRYERNLSEAQRELLKSFIRFKKANTFQKAYLMYKHGFQKHGFFRNCREVFSS